ncbi:MAG: hypothetical protein ACRCYO_06785 [Bacteroidia bacterium]
MKPQHSLLLLLCLCPFFAKAQTDTLQTETTLADSMFIERIGFVGGGVCFRNRVSELPSLPDQAIDHVSNADYQTLYVGKKTLDQYYFITNKLAYLEYTRPIKKRLEIQADFFIGHLVYQNQFRVISSISNIANTSEYAVSTDYARLSKKIFTAEVELAMNWLFLQRPKLQMGFGAGISACQFLHEFDSRTQWHNDFVQHFSIPIRVRIHENRWIQLAPEMSFRYHNYSYSSTQSNLYKNGVETGQLMFGLKTGIVFGRVVQCRVRPKHKSTLANEA